MWLYVADPQWRDRLTEMNPSDALSGNGVDELRYLFLVSQVAIMAQPHAVDVPYVLEEEGLWIGVDHAKGEKCVRCWNYAESVGQSALHPQLCDRCQAALEGMF